MHKSILVALDDSPRALPLLDTAVGFARAFGTSLILCRVIPLPVVQMSPDGLPVGVDLETELEKKAMAELEALRHHVPKEIETRLITILDVAWEGICEVGKREDVALIVIGSHGYAGLADRILGTTAAKVVNHADRSVLVVRSPDAK